MIFLVALFCILIKRAEETRQNLKMKMSLATMNEDDRMKYQKQMWDEEAKGKEAAEAEKAASGKGKAGALMNNKWPT